MAGKGDFDSEEGEDELDYDDEEGDVAEGEKEDDEDYDEEDGADGSDAAKPTKRPH